METNGWRAGSNGAPEGVPRRRRPRLRERLAALVETLSAQLGTLPLEVQRWTEAQAERVERGLEMEVFPWTKGG